MLHSAALTGAPVWSYISLQQLRGHVQSFSAVLLPSHRRALYELRKAYSSSSQLYAKNINPFKSNVKIKNLERPGEGRARREGKAYNRK
jgi:hypothetical protein